MLEDVALLVQIQETDIEISQLESVINQKPSSIDELNRQLVSVKETLEKLDNLKNESIKKQRAFERDIQDNHMLIKKNHEKSRSIKSNKEYQAVLKEMDDIKEKNSSLEEGVIRCMCEQDELSTKITDAKQQELKLKTSVDEEQKKFDNDIEHSKQKKETVLKKRNSLIPKISSQLLKRYDILRGYTINNIAVVCVENSICKGCFTNIPPQMYIELQKATEIMFCPSCQRIIYHRND